MYGAPYRPAQTPHKKYRASPNPLPEGAGHAEAAGEDKASHKRGCVWVGTSWYPPTTTTTTHGTPAKHRCRTAQPRQLVARAHVPTSEWSRGAPPVNKLVLDDRHRRPVLLPRHKPAHGECVETHGMCAPQHVHPRVCRREPGSNTRLTGGGGSMAHTGTLEYEGGRMPQPARTQGAEDWCSVDPKAPSYPKDTSSATRRFQARGGRAPAAKRLCVDAEGRAHGALDVQALDVLPVLLGQGHQEVDGLQDVVHHLLL